MPRITYSNVQQQLGDYEVYDIVNMIRNENPNFAQYVPLADAENVTEIGQAIMVNSTTQNDFITSLVDRISLTIVRGINLSNPLSKFKKGRIELGKVVQEIFVDLTKEKAFDAEDAENTLFKREIPNAKSLYHERNRQGRYDQTITEDQLKTAFTSWGSFGNFVAGIINAIYNSAEVDEYRYMKLMVDNAYSKGLMTVVPVTKPDTETTAREFVKKARATYTKMTLPQGSRDYNALAVHTRSFENGLHLFIDADLNAELDVDVLAKAFNLDRTTLLGNITIIDGLASQGLEAVLLDDQWYQVYDNNIQLTTVYNAKGLYWNYFYHVWQTLSTSRFSNCVAFVSGEIDPITQVIIDPALASIRAGKTLEYNKFIRLGDSEYKVGATADATEKTYTLTWNVEGYNGATLDAGTSINTEGVLTVGTNQTGDLKVTLTATYDTGEVDGGGAPILESKIGESLVNIVPVA